MGAHLPPPTGLSGSFRTGGKINPSYRDVFGYMKLGVFPKGYPNIELLTFQLTATQKAILVKVEGQRKEPKCNIW